MVAVGSLASRGDIETDQDPLVGTWRQQSIDPQTSMAPLIITKTPDGYLGTVVFWGPDETPASPRPTIAIPLTRDGDKLLGRYPEMPDAFGSGRLRVEITILPESGHLTWANSRTEDGPLDTPIEMVKVSDGTAYPTSR